MTEPKKCGPLGGPVQIADLGIWDELRRKYEVNPKG
jgi:hypothetical protein